MYRITTVQWSRELTASGNAARWNSKGRYVIYTAESRALACLENLVHRSGEGDNRLYKVMLITIPASVKVEVIDISKLKKDWFVMEQYPYCQSIGNDWLQKQQSAILKVPSVVIKKEYNYLINPQHPDFKKIKLSATEDFDFDSRI
ncbi:MAG TPA: RES family NAD+ phosphorylase [Ferruginibacter sp.]|nr:RES family NAD+ phosphorylase [Ferruginibacter sp.]HMP21186.1 RES family NAD+ phosphorylase [Ferruginibacter sp.]